MANSKDKSQAWGKRVVVGVSMQPEERELIRRFLKRKGLKNLSEFIREAALAKVKRARA